ncbi:alpha/beta-hydrolase family protein [Knoellia sinensis]|uniref:alpha/beta-hydrolase family protein n=1 Tax=Knoellia sinensis TaxID=136100 RepID=UPI0014707B64|nr:alpha/beta-hydrolase family protein [Knoellia sinensis]
MRGLLSRLSVPRASAALATPIALGAAMFPSFLPHLPVALGVMTGMAWLITHAVVRRLVRRLAGRDRHLTGPTHVLAVVLGGALTAYVLGWTLVAQNGMRARIGMDPVSLADVGIAAGTAVALVGVVRGLGWLWRHRSRVSRRGVALIAGLTLVTFAPASAQAASDSDQVLLTPSPVGAVRAYAGLSDSEDDATRARIAVDRLAAAGGLTREHLLVAIPTGSGWVNPEFVRGVEERFGAEVATVSMQYDDRPSWMAYLFDRDGAVSGARALLAEVTASVSAMPAAQRPQVHVVGESLGATAGQSAMLAPGAGGDAARATVCSTFWLGTPGGGRTGLPQETVAANPDDPIVHASPAMAWRPATESRAWLPVVSAVHAGADVLGSLAVPFGSGHRYGADQALRLQTCDGSGG